MLLELQNHFFCHLKKKNEINKSSDIVQKGYMQANACTVGATKCVMHLVSDGWSKVEANLDNGCEISIFCFFGSIVFGKLLLSAS